MKNDSEMKLPSQKDIIQSADVYCKRFTGSEDDESRVNQSWRDELSDNISPAETSKPPPCAVVVGGHERSPTSQSTETASQHGRHPYQPPPAEYSHVRTNSVLVLIFWSAAPLRCIPNVLK